MFFETVYKWNVPFGHILKIPLKSEIQIWPEPDLGVILAGAGFGAELRYTCIKMEVDVINSLGTVIGEQI